MVSISSVVSLDFGHNGTALGKESPGTRSMLFRQIFEFAFVEVDVTRSDFSDMRGRPPDILYSSPKNVQASRYTRLLGKQDGFPAFRFVRCDYHPSSLCSLLRSGLLPNSDPSDREQQSLKY